MSFKPAIPSGFRAATSEELQRIKNEDAPVALALFESDGIISGIYVADVFDALDEPAKMARDYDLASTTIQRRTVENIGDIQCGVLVGKNTKDYDVLALLCPTNQRLAQFILTTRPDLTSELAPTFRTAVAQSEGLTLYRTDGRREQSYLGHVFMLVAVGGLVGQWIRRRSRRTKTRS